MTSDAPMPVPETAAAPRSSRRWVKWLLTISLALNALLIGSIAGAVWRHGGPPSAFNTNVPANFLVYADSLPKSRPGGAFNDIREYRRSLQPLRRSLQEARREIIGAISADPFQRERFLEAHKRLSEIEGQFRSQQADVLADIAGRMTAEERRGYARWWEQRRPRMGRGRGDDDGELPKK